MNSVQALEHDFLRLPKSYDDSTTFLNFVDQTFKNYLTIIESIDEGTIVDKLKETKEKIKFLCQGLLESYRQLYLGFVFKSYNHFDLGLKEIEPFLFDRGVTHPLSENRTFYRGRISDKQLDKNQMFHLPFELRHIATTQRFSIPGLPCLYLGDASYVCWEELNRPSDDKFYVSRYEISDYSKLIPLDISWTPQKITTMITRTLEVTGSIDTWDKMTLNYLVKWPIIFCCSIKVRNEIASFKPEYIIPQYLLDWVRSNRNLNCIKYFSVKTHLFQNIDYSSFTNVVIPVQEIQDNGYCNHLKGCLTYTNPQRMDSIDETKDIPKEEIENYILNYRHDTILLTELKDFDKDYLRSKFGRIELKLCLEKTLPL